MSNLANVARRSNVRYLIGKCRPSAKDNAIKVQVTSLKLDEHLKMYFKEHNDYFAVNAKNAQVGDTVLIRNLQSQLTRLITHEIVEVVYPLGDVTDPITGKKVVGSQYRDDMDELTEAYGKLDSAFDYEKAPPRGSMKNKRDFTYEETYIKYQDDPKKPQPYGIDPF